MNQRIIISYSISFVLVLSALLMSFYGYSKLTLWLVSFVIFLMVSATGSKAQITLENFVLFSGFLYASGILFLDFTYVNIELFILINISVLIVYFFLRLSRISESLNTHKLLFLKSEKVDLSFAPIVAATIGLFGLCILFYILIVKVDFSSYVYITRAQRALIYRDIGVLALFREMLISGGLLLLFCYFLSRKKWLKYLSIFILSVSVIHAVLTISRTELILVFVPILFMLVFFDVVTEKFVIVTALLLTPLVLLWKSILYLLFFNNNGEINYSISELVSWYHIGEDIIRLTSNGDIEYMYGGSIVDGLLSLIYPFYNATPLSVWYSKDILSLYGNGTGRGFSMVVESYLNFGIFGIFLVMPFLSTLLYFMFRLFHNTWIYPYVYCITPAFINKIFRSEFYSLTKTFWWIFIVPLVLIFLFSERKRLSL